MGARGIIRMWDGRSGARPSRYSENMVSIAAVIVDLGLATQELVA